MKHVEGIVIDRDGSPLTQGPQAHESRQTSQDELFSRQFSGAILGKGRGFVGSILSSPLKLAALVVIGLPIAALLLTLFGLVFLFAVLFGKKSFVKIIKF